MSFLYKRKNQEKREEKNKRNTDISREEEGNRNIPIRTPFVTERKEEYKPERMEKMKKKKKSKGKRKEGSSFNIYTRVFD